MELGVADTRTLPRVQTSSSLEMAAALLASTRALTLRPAATPRVRMKMQIDGYGAGYGANATTPFAPGALIPPAPATTKPELDSEAMRAVRALAARTTHRTHPPHARTARTQSSSTVSMCNQWCTWQHSSRGQELALPLVRA